MNKTMLNRLVVLIALLGALTVFGLLLALYNKNKKNCFSSEIAVENYHNNKDVFIKLINFIRRDSLGPFTDIEFLKNGDIVCYFHGNLSSGFPTYLVDIDINDRYRSRIVDINMLPNKDLQILLFDTTLVLNSWSWYFEGGESSNGYKFALKYLNLTNYKLNLLRDFISKIDCKSIEIKTNGDIVLRFCGELMYQAQYVFSEQINYHKVGYTTIDNNFYFGIYKEIPSY